MCQVDMDIYIDFVAINGLYNFDIAKNKFIEVKKKKK
jgi:hypothetical protein